MTLLHFHLQKQKFLRRFHEAEICVLFDQAKKSHPCGQVLSGQDLGKILHLEQKSTRFKINRSSLSQSKISKTDQLIHDSDQEGAKLLNLSQLRGRLSLVFYPKFDSDSVQDLKKIISQKEYGHCLGLLAKTRLISDSSQVSFEFVSKQDLESFDLRSGGFQQEIFKTIHQSNTFMQILSPVPRLTACFTLGQIFFISLLDSLANNGN